MKKFTDIRLACVEDGLDNTGFRKIAAFIKSINPNTKVAYVPTANHRNLVGVLLEKAGGNLDKNDIHKVAKFMAEGEIAAFSSMTQSSKTVYKIISEIRKINSQTYIVWGGIHPIIQPEDAIKHADAVCTGEGEFAFKTFLEHFEKGEDFTKTPSFWFRKDEKIIKNRNLPLMSPRQMDALPPLSYDDGEVVYRRGKGFVKASADDYLDYSGLQYGTVWSVGCPLHCTYCGNTKFIEYDNAYRRIRHSSPQTIIDEIKRAISKQPHLSTVAFHDDSFLSLPYEQLKEFAELYKAQIKIPFVIYGVIPTYVREDKIALLLDAGMNRVRMGIQSGSDNILEFYKRPTKLYRIKEATEILNKFKKYMIPPSYDIILENPIETPEDTRATVDMLYEMPRPYTLNIYALRVIPNTAMATELKKRGVETPPIDKNYFVDYHRTLGNCLVFALTFWKMPRWLYNRLRKRILPVQTKQPLYPVLFTIVRSLFYIKKAFDHIRFMDFSVLPGKLGYVLWKTGIIKFWKKFFLRQYNLSEYQPSETKLK
jgi:anaerobic magnesium-protoporphyrin IX monomethyl ester cyclase